MKSVYYNKRQLVKFIYSAIFGIGLFTLVFMILIKEKSYAILIVYAPIMTWFVGKSIVLVIDLWKITRKRRIFIELTENDIQIYTIKNKINKIDFDQIKSVKFEDDSIYIYHKKKNDCGQTKTLRNLFGYYLEDIDGLYSYPIYCNEEDVKEMEGILKSNNIPCLEQENKREFVNLCSRYIFIIMGIIAAFLIEAVAKISLQQSILIIVILIAAALLLHKYDKINISSDKATPGLIIRCVMCSFMISHYIITACYIEEAITGSIFELDFSVKGILIIGIMYIIAFILFIPQNGVGKKIILFLETRKSERNIVQR